MSKTDIPACTISGPTYMLTADINPAMYEIISRELAAIQQTGEEELRKWLLQHGLMLENNCIKPSDKRPAVDYKFRNDIVSHVPTCALIEVAQALEDAIADKNWSAVTACQDYIAEHIERYTTVPDGLNITPSVTSLIAMGSSSGILMDGKNDFLCESGFPVSVAGDTRLCNSCQYHSYQCFPERCRVLLKGGHLYVRGEDDALLDFLEGGEPINPNSVNEDLD